MALPIWMIKDLQMRPLQKLGLGVLFSLGTIVIVFEIVRSVKSIQKSTTFSEVAVYDITEACVAVIVSSIPTYRSLLKSDRRRKDGTYRYLKSSSKKSHGTADSHPLDEFHSASVDIYNTSRTELQPDLPRSLSTKQAEQLAVPERAYG